MGAPAPAPRSGLNPPIPLTPRAAAPAAACVSDHSLACERIPLRHRSNLQRKKQHRHSGIFRVADLGPGTMPRGKYPESPAPAGSHALISRTPPPGGMLHANLGLPRPPPRNFQPPLPQQALKTNSNSAPIKPVSFPSSAWECVPRSSASHSRSRNCPQSKRQQHSPHRHSGISAARRRLPLELRLLTPRAAAPAAACVADHSRACERIPLRHRSNLQRKKQHRHSGIFRVADLGPGTMPRGKYPESPAPAGSHALISRTPTPGGMLHANLGLPRPPPRNFQPPLPQQPPKQTATAPPHKTKNQSPSCCRRSGSTRNLICGVGHSARGDSGADLGV